MEGRMKTAHDITTRLRTDDVLNEENGNVDFASLLLSGPVLEGLQGAGFQRPSPIQLKAIPLGRCGLDLILQAKSGTGKTCVFSVIALECVDVSSNATQVLILAPTREIAVQIQQVILDIGQMMPKLKCHVFIGGTLIGPDKQNLKKCHIAVGTPGRVKQLIETGVLVPDSIRLFILDEADKLLDDKFQSQINWIYNELPYSKQIVAASATYPEFLAQHLTSYMRDATFVRLNPKEIALHGIRQYYKLVEGHDLPHKAFALKVNDLIDLLSNVTFQQCLVFSNLHTRAENLCDILCQRGWPSMFISGGLEQKQRLHAMSTFKKFECRVLISTDLTARGIDAEKVNLVINLDVPVDVKTYMHRIGRAGRFGTYGAAITLASFGRDELLLNTIQKESHVAIKPLPAPVPSDLLSPSVGVGIATLKSVKNTVDVQEYKSKSNKSRLPNCDLARRDSGTLSSSNGQTFHLDCFGSADHSITMAPVKKLVMFDEACQTVDPTSVLNIITSEIPSLTETLDLRNRCPKWSFAGAMNEFKHFMKTGEFEFIQNGDVLEKTCKSDMRDDSHDSESTSHGNHRKSVAVIQETLTSETCDEQRENKKCHETEEPHNMKDTKEEQGHSLPIQEKIDKSMIFEETIENGKLHNMISEGTRDCKIEDECRFEGMTENEQGHRLPMREMIGRIEAAEDLYSTSNFRSHDEHNENKFIDSVDEDLADRRADTSDSKSFKGTPQNKKTKKCKKPRRKGEAFTCKRNRDIHVEEVGLSTDGTISRRSWTEKKDEKDEVKKESGQEKDETHSCEEVYTSSVYGSEDSALSMTDGEEEDSTSNIFILKDGVFVQISSKKRDSSRNTVSKEFEDPSNDESRSSGHSPELPEMEEANNVDGGREDKTLKKRKLRFKKHTEKTGDSFHNSSHYDYSGYPSYYYNGNVPDSQYPMSHMGYHSYYNNGKETDTPSSYYNHHSGYPSPYYNGYAPDLQHQTSHMGYHSYYNNGKETDTQSSYYNHPSYYNNDKDTTSSYYDHSGYPSHYNGYAPDSQHQMSHMGYHSGTPYYDTTGGWPTWPYFWNTPYWPTYPADMAGFYSQFHGNSQHCNSQYHNDWK